MLKIEVTLNDANQRFDRYLKKLFENAPLSAIYKNLRKKNFKINDKRAKKDDFVNEGDIITMYISKDNYEKWTKDKKTHIFEEKLNVVYEDENLIIMDKPKGILSHSASKSDYGNNMLDYMLSYLYRTKAVNPKDKTFTPALVNRLDRNTQGLLIGAKNHESLICLNKAIKNRLIDKYYLTITKGKISKEYRSNLKISKNENRNKVKADDDGLDIVTEFKPLEYKNGYSLVQCKLITGKTHQIRYSLKNNNTPIIGDRKYGDKHLNEMLYRKFKLKNQLLLAYKLKFNHIKGLEYLENKTFTSNQLEDFNKLKDMIFNEK